MRQGHHLDQPWAGGLSGKRLFLLRASELVGSELASPARGNSRSYFLALSPPKANHAQPRMKVERLQRATATCGLGNETIGLPVIPIPGGLPRARKSLGTVRSQPPHTSAVARGTVYVQGETRGTQSVCTLPSWHVRTKCVHQNAHAFGPWCGGEHGACRPVPIAWRGRRPRGRPLRPPMAADCCPRHLPSRQRYASLETNQTLEDSDAGGERCWGEGETIEGPSNAATPPPSAHSRSLLR